MELQGRQEVIFLPGDALRLQHIVECDAKACLPPRIVKTDRYIGLSARADRCLDLGCKAVFGNADMLDLDVGMALLKLGYQRAVKILKFAPAKVPVGERRGF